MGITHLLPLRCSIFRGAVVTTLNYMPTSEGWSLVSAGVPCRYDPNYHYRSLGDTMPEEIVGRDNALLFLDTSADIKVRDIVIVTNDATGYMNDRQYDVIFVNPTLGLAGMHHLEVTVSFRDNNVELP